MLQFNTSLATNELDHALVAFRMAMNPIDKDKSVKMSGTSKSGKEFNVSYDYAPLEDIQSQCKAPLIAAGLSITQDLSCIISHDGKVVAGIVTRVSHISGQWKSSFWPLDLSKVTKEQDRGIAITYNKRYAYAGALDINIGGEDTDAQPAVDKSVDKPKTIPNEAFKPPQDPPKDPGPSEAQIKRLFAIAKKQKYDNEFVKSQMIRMFKKDSSKLLTWSEYKTFTDAMEMGFPK